MLFPTITSQHWSKFFSQPKPKKLKMPSPEQIHINRVALLATERFRIFKPDALELRWNIFDTQEKRTVGYGDSPETAIDNALRYVKTYSIPLATKNYVL